METTHAKVKIWGRSLGVVIPKGVAVKANLKEGDSIDISITKKTRNPIKDTFGTLKMKTPTRQLLKESD